MFIVFDIDYHGFSTEESVSQKTRVKYKEPIPSPSRTANFLKQELEIQLFNTQMGWIIMICKKDRMVGP